MGGPLRVQRGAMPCAGAAAQGCVCSVAQHTPRWAMCAMCWACSAAAARSARPSALCAGTEQYRVPRCGCGHCRIILYQVGPDSAVCQGHGDWSACVQEGQTHMSGVSRAAAHPSLISGWEIQTWQAGGGTWCSAEAELSGAVHLLAVAPRDPREILAHRRLLAAAAVPSGSPFPAPASTGETKAGAAAGRGLRRGCWRNGTAAFLLLPYRIFQGHQAWGPWAQPLPGKPWGGVCALPSASHACFLSSDSGNFITFSDLHLYPNISSDQQGHFRMKPLITCIK